MRIHHVLRVLACVLSIAEPWSAGVYAATITVTSADDSGPGSLRNAIELAASGDEIRFDETLDGVPIRISSGDLAIHRDLRIVGRGLDLTSIEYADGPADDFFILLGIDPGIAVVLEELTLKGGAHRDPFIGLRAIVNDGNLTLIDCVVEQFTDTRYVISNGGYLTLLRTVVRQNRVAFGSVLVNGGTIYIDHSTVEGNQEIGGIIDTAGLQTFGTAIVVNSVFRDNSSGGGGAEGGAILNNGLLRVIGSVIIGNQAGGLGGGIYNGGKADISESLIANNHGEREGGGISNYGELVMVNSTVHGNTSVRGVGGVENSGNLTLVGSTISSNVGEDAGVWGRSTLIGNSLIIGNHSVDPVVFGGCGVFASLGGNIVGGDEGTCFGIVDGQDGDRVGIPLEAVLEHVDAVYWPFLYQKAVLADNGGPTLTVALLPKSPAIDSIASGGCTDHEGNPIMTDQRGVSRPQGPACDVGAFEFSLPRGAGFWAHQCSDKGFKQVGADEMQALFDKVVDRSSAFPECAPVGCEALEPRAPMGDMQKRAGQQLLGSWLNLASGRLTWGRPIELSGLTSSFTVGEALEEIGGIVCDPSASRSEMEKARDIAEALNNQGEDMELAAMERSLTLQPGEARLVTLGLVNMSQDHRNYQISGSGKWPMQLSTTRVNALGSGQVALVTATVVAPLDAGGQTGRISASATDLQSETSLRREAVIELRVVDHAPSKDPGRRLPRIE